jgi:hypothetical protein
MALITRQSKGSKLSIVELDNNLTYLEELALQGGGGSSGPQGPQGPQGTEGQIGPQGPEGINGLSIELESGLDPTVFSTLVKTTDTGRVLGDIRESWRLFASTPLQSFDPYVGSENVYVKYIGKIVVPVGVTLNVSTSQSSFSSVDSDFGILVTPFGPGGLVTNFNTGEVQSVQFAALQVDNTLFEEEYEFWIIAGDSNDFESSVIIDILISVQEGVEITLDRG